MKLLSIVPWALHSLIDVVLCFFFSLSLSRFLFYFIFSFCDNLYACFGVQSTRQAAAAAAASCHFSFN